MYIRTKRESLMPALAKVGGVVERRQTLPILGNFLLCTEQDSVEITGTDLEVEIRARAPAIVERAGKITVPARKIVDICRALPDGIEIALKVEKDRASLAAGRSRFTLSTLPASDFPSMEGGSDAESIDIQSDKLKLLVEKTSFAMAMQDVRYYLNGLLVEVKPDRIVTVATDGHRLAKVEAEIQFDIEKNVEIILPRKAVLELNRLLGNDSELVRLDISEKIFRSFVGETTLTSKLIDGRFPDYDRVIPRVCERIAHTDKEAFRQALLRTSILSNEKYRGVKLDLGYGKLRLQTHNPEQEEAEEEIELDYAQEPTVIGFNVGYLLDVLNVLEGNDVELGFNDSNGSALVRNSGIENETFVVMPMRL